VADGTGAIVVFMAMVPTSLSIFRSIGPALVPSAAFVDE